VGVLFDPSSQKVKFDNGDPRLSLRANGRAEQEATAERVRRGAEEAPGTPSPEQGISRTIEPGDQTTLRG
jgi:hypothetical protein